MASFADLTSEMDATLLASLKDGRVDYNNRWVRTNKWMSCLARSSG